MLIYYLLLCNRYNFCLSSHLLHPSAQTAALFSLSCSVTAMAQPSASQLSSQRWRESIARRRRSLPGTAVCCPSVCLAFIATVATRATVTQPSHLLLGTKLLTNAALIQVLEILCWEVDSEVALKQFGDTNLLQSVGFGKFCSGVLI